jgi:hypothetical protein
MTSIGMAEAFSPKDAIISAAAAGYVSRRHQRTGESLVTGWQSRKINLQSILTPTRVSTLYSNAPQQQRSFKVNTNN